MKHGASPSLRVALAIFAMVAAGCAALFRASPSEPSNVVRSNLLRADYAGSTACRPCHQQIYDAFLAAPMHRMTRRADGAAVKAPFDGQVFRFKGDSATMLEVDGRRYMRVESSKRGSKLYRVTKVIGGRYREDFVGQEVESTAADSPIIQDDDGERVMPVSWLLFEPAWRYKGYSVMVSERQGFAPGMIWRQTCIFCHNTSPRLASLYDDLLPTVEKYQGSVSERFLPTSRTWGVEATDDDALIRAIRAEIAVLGVPQPEGTLPNVLGEAAVDTLLHFDEQHLVELGIGCEACHNGSKEHTKDPRRRPSFEFRSAALRVTPGTPDVEPTRAAWINRTCARCHTVLFSEYRYTWEGGERDRSPGGSNINSGEARDFILGGCADRMACTSCHDPHTESRREHLDKLGKVAGNGVCTACHEELKSPSAVSKHTHHRPESEGSACLSCHMPRKNMGLAYRLTRYHRIGSPNDPVRVEKDRPLECALCHADRSVGSLVTTMERWWGRRYDRRKLHELYGRMGANPLVATLVYGKPHEQATAAAALGERGAGTNLRFIADQLVHDYPLVRYFARDALARASGRPVPIDVDQDKKAIDAAVEAWFGAESAHNESTP